MLRTEQVKTVVDIEYGTAQGTQVSFPSRTIEISGRRLVVPETVWFFDWHGELVATRIKHGKEIAVLRRE